MISSPDEFWLSCSHSYFHLLSSLSLLPPLSPSLPVELHVLCADPLPALLSCLHLAADHSCALKGLTWETSWPLLDPFDPPRAIFHETVTSRFPAQGKSVLLKSRLILPCSLLLNTTASWSLQLRLPSAFRLRGECQV